MEKDLEDIHRELGIGGQEIEKNRLPRAPQAALNDLRVVEIDFEGKPFILMSKAAVAWKLMKEQAKSDGVFLEPFSGFRSYRHQKQLISRRLSKGRSLESILKSVAIPGFSEHHTGRAVDVIANECRDLIVDFEKTEAFEWLRHNAEDFNFYLSYPKNNVMGIVYEPWHWCYQS